MDGGEDLLREVVLCKITGLVTTLESLIIVPLVIKVPQSNGGVKIVLYDFLTAMSLS